jgi:hypothetical protein
VHPVECVRDVVPPLLHAGVAEIRARDRRLRPVANLDLRIAHLWGGVSLLERSEPAPDGLNVLVAHPAGFSITAARPWPTPMHIVATP